MTRKNNAQPKADQQREGPDEAAIRHEAAILDDAATPAGVPVVTPKISKLDQLTVLLRRDGGASLAEMEAATNWQKHSIRGAMAGALKKRGLAIISGKLDGVRRYQAAAA